MRGSRLGGLLLWLGLVAAVGCRTRPLADRVALDDLHSVDMVVFDLVARDLETRDLETRDLEARDLPFDDLATLDLQPHDSLSPDLEAPPETLLAMCGLIPSSAAEWETCFARRYCDVIVNCAFLNGYASATECFETRDELSGRQLAFDRAERIRAVADGRATIDETQFTECLRAIGRTHCNTAGTAPSCQLRYHGTIADGLPCWTDVECSSPGATCDAASCTGACCAGTCAPKQPLGASCVGAGKRCEPGLVCKAALGVCASGEPGTACSSPGDCLAASWCDRPAFNLPGTCHLDLAEGEPCTSVLACGEETVCVGLRRNVTGTPTCRRAIAEGDACDDFCLGNLYCDLASTTGLGTCRSMPGLGEACGSFLPCLGATTICDETTGVCIERFPDGASCEGNWQCRLGHFCTADLGAPSGVCRPLFEVGEAGCLQDWHCTSHLCDGALGLCLAPATTCP